MTLSLLRLLLAASLLVGAVPWSGAAAIAGIGDVGPGMVAGGPTDGMVLPAECVLQPERPAKKGVLKSVDIQSVPETTVRPVGTPQRVTFATPDRAPRHRGWPFLRPETRAPPSLAI